MQDTASTQSQPGALSRFMDRRAFLRSSVSAGAGGLFLSTSKNAIAQATDPNRRLKCALVGCGSQGNALRLASKDVPGVQWVAVADIWAYPRTPTARRMAAENSHQVDGAVAEYDTLEELLEKQKDVEAVFIATPDFLHAPMSRMALEAGKSVYCEKMMSNTIEGALDMVRAWQQTGGIFQIGHQRHSNPRYLNFRDNVVRRANLLGRITHAYGQWNRGVSASKMIGMPKNQQPISQELLSANGYDSMDEYLNWRWFAKYGGGPISDLGAHQIDMFNWTFGATPKSLFATGGVDYYDGKDGRALFELPDNVMCLYEYELPEGITRAYYQVLTTTGSQGFYEKYMGVSGTVVISESPSYNQAYAEPDNDWTKWAEGEEAIIVKAADDIKNKFWEQYRDWDKPKPPSYTLASKADARESKGLDPWELAVTLNRLPHSPHVQNFVEAALMKNHDHLTCNVVEAYRGCVTVLKAYESISTGQKYVFKPEDFAV
jgi:predicted dehydrogenase